MPTFKKGNELYQLLVRLLGVDRATMENELHRLMQRMNICPDQLTMAELRRVAVAFLEDIDSKCRPRVLRSRRRVVEIDNGEEIAEA